MDYICYIDTTNSTVPFMDVVPTRELEVAREHARRLLSERPASLAARLFQGDVLVEIVLPQSDD